MQRRLKGFLVTGECVAAFLRAGSRTVSVTSECPESAEFFTSHFDHKRNCFVVVMEDESFGMLAEGCEIPIDGTAEVTIP